MRWRRRGGRRGPGRQPGRSGRAGSRRPWGRDVDGKNGASEGFDCSSLVQYAYWPSTRLPRTAAAQYAATSHRPIARDQLRPGDLLFWSRRGGDIYHVGLYAGDGQVLHAPRTGRNVEVQSLTEAMPARDFLGATRA
ncbi:C40 family peptidase [Streptomyces sp. NBC_00335]|uniref:C40 family peptidase n=1 Tax=unclassified Streptomyces TaxID=2593676 RepID=UPI00224E91B8|nr:MULTISPECIES: C40 family peptidase [unclassified Streptomyces]MCX5410160.1 C40 family peptidase [Streptomyces sp. NBC_00086]